MKFTSYWLDTAPKGPLERSKTTVEGRTDVAVIGGGLTGVVAALHLARRGAKVHLFEQHTVGFGSTWPSSVQVRIPVLLKPGRGVVLVRESEGGRGLLCMLAPATCLQHRVS